MSQGYIFKVFTNNLLDFIVLDFKGHFCTLYVCTLHVHTYYIHCTLYGHHILCMYVCAVHVHCVYSLFISNFINFELLSFLLLVGINVWQSYLIFS